MRNQKENCLLAAICGFGLLAAACQTTEPRLATPELAAGRRIYTTQCIACHSPEPVAKYSLAEWDDILKTMAGRAKLDSTQRTQLHAYIAAAHAGKR